MRCPRCQELYAEVYTQMGCNEAATKAELQLIHKQQHEPAWLRRLQAKDYTRA